MLTVSLFSVWCAYCLTILGLVCLLSHYSRFGVPTVCSAALLQVGMKLSLAKKKTFSKFQSSGLVSRQLKPPSANMTQSATAEVVAAKHMPKAVSRSVCAEQYLQLSMLRSICKLHKH